MIEVGCPTCGKSLECQIEEKPFENPVSCCTWIYIGIPPEEPRIQEYRPTDVIQKCTSLLVYTGEEGEMFAVNKKEAEKYNKEL
ncbi:hypothetical protein [Methanonatronarchaeum sp. AMET-Sl]|uniref:hypothetical protein n=1 Tax=Methanonatronarchaeum sp. AMET-Sl TaxID=3037654 RepID=UPI00244E238C|nr:hypothetical protein [Methanonatronarchaeum sp. AMET-Sl]WGI17074.1 hypothetical protein QEN48_06130 [Methanonatronarchaeum sp. AMET-Sl]